MATNATMTTLSPVAPILGTSKYMIFNNIMVTLLCLIVVIPYLVNRKMAAEYPNLYLPSLGAANLLLNIGFWIGAFFDYNPLRYLGPLCTVQWFFLGLFGVTCLLILFFYIYGLYELVALGKPAKYLAWKQKYIILGCFLTGLIAVILIPLGFPFATGEVFGPAGPYCGIRSLLVMTIAFYSPTVPFCFVAIILAARIIYVVYRTTRNATAVPVQQNSTRATEHAKHKAARQARLNRFYARVCVYVILYSGATIGAFIKRILELLNTDWQNVNHVNDQTWGLTILLPILAFLQMAVLTSTPQVARFWTKQLPGMVMGRAFYSSMTGGTSGHTAQDRKGMGQGKTQESKLTDMVVSVDRTVLDTVDAPDGGNKIVPAASP